VELTATYKFAAPPAAVWVLLMDPDAIAKCLPGCRELRPAGDNRYHAELSFGVAAVSGTFVATVALSDTIPPESYRLDVDATSKPGFVHGSAVVELKRTDAGTDVVVSARAEVGGLIARVGQRLLEGVGRMTMDRFFDCLSKRME
jgi:carbon monoxide dehydrogenase subunit G